MGMGSGGAVRSWGGGEGKERAQCGETGTLRTGCQIAVYSLSTLGCSGRRAYLLTKVKFRRESDRYIPV